jgi:hypothetical protein
MKNEIEKNGQPPPRAFGYTPEEIRAMKSAISTFAQVVQPLRGFHLIDIARETEANKATKKFGAEQHLHCMVFGQLAGVTSLREMEVGLELFRGELNHLGIPFPPSHSTLSYANAHRPWQFFERVFYETLNRVRNMVENPVSGLNKKFKFKDRLYLIDSTTIDLCHSLFDWANFRSTKGGIKLHLMLESDTYLPVWAYISEAKCHDKTALETIDPVRGLPKGSFVCMDRAYNDYSMLNSWNERGINFVCRAKDNMAYKVLEELPVPNRIGRPSSPGTVEEPRSHVISDQVVALTGKKAQMDYPETLRAVTFYVHEEENSRRKSRVMTFFTNNFTLSSNTIAQIYKSRWSIEAFFKLIKQNLKIKSFLGTSPNAVKIQLYTALITILILKYLQAISTSQWCLPHILKAIRFSLYLNRDFLYFLNRKRPLTPTKEGCRPPNRRGVLENRLF